MHGVAHHDGMVTWAWHLMNVPHRVACVAYSDRFVLRSIVWLEIRSRDGGQAREAIDRRGRVGHGDRKCRVLIVSRCLHLVFVAGVHVVAPQARRPERSDGEEGHQLIIAKALE